MKNDLQDLLDQFVQDWDIYAIDLFIETLSPDEVSTNKTAITEAYMEIYYMWLYDLDCNRIQEEDQEDFIYELIAILDSVEKVDPVVIHHEERASCYKLLANIQTKPEQKTAYFQEAINIYRNAIQHTEYKELNASLARTLLDQAAVNNIFNNRLFDEVRQLFHLAYTEYSENVMRIFLYACFDIFEYNFDGKEQVHADFILHFSTVTHTFAKKDVLIYLKWSNELSRIIDSNHYPVSATYYDELNNFILELLAHLTEYSTDSQNLLNDLGHEFEHAAKRITDNPSLKATFYNHALNYFMQAQEINPFAWTYTVYATNVLKEIACMYVEMNQPEKAIAAFEKGRSVFTNMIEPDFTAHLNWGRFLIEYARLAYNFEAPYLLKEAEEKLSIAKTLGENYYDEPYLLLAKIALKCNDVQHCIELLKECKFIFTTPYSVYSLSKVTEDADFSDIWDNEIFND